MAMLPFAGYNINDYFRHWLQMGQQMTRPPKIFHVNWFRTDEEGQYLWPGYGDNLRVLEWVLDRCRGEAEAAATPIGHVPTPDSLDMTGLDLPPKVVEDLLRVDPNEWMAEVASIREFFGTLGDRLPHALVDELSLLERRLKGN
jgi:phosphoenolpyruvate carboxykinase (GTP)